MTNKNEGRNKFEVKPIVWTVAHPDIGGPIAVLSVNYHNALIAEYKDMLVKCNETNAADYDKYDGEILNAKVKITQLELKLQLKDINEQDIVALRQNARRLDLENKKYNEQIALKDAEILKLQNALAIAKSAIETVNYSEFNDKSTELNQALRKINEVISEKN